MVHCLRCVRVKYASLRVKYSILWPLLCRNMAAPSSDSLPHSPSVIRVAYAVGGGALLPKSLRNDTAIKKITEYF